MVLTFVAAPVVRLIECSSEVVAPEIFTAANAWLFAPCDVEGRNRLHVADAERADGEQIAEVRIAGRLALDLQPIVARIEHIQSREACAGEGVGVRRRDDASSRPGSTPCRWSPRPCRR